MKENTRKMIALSLKMIRIGKQMEAEKRKLKELVDRGYGYGSPEIKPVLAQYMRDKAAWEEAERAYLALRDSDG